MNLKNRGDGDSRIMMIKNECTKILKGDFEELRKFFKNIIAGKYDCIVFISRRCYILFQMYALIEGWKSDVICTDLGIYAMRNKLKMCKTLMVVDDIGFTGVSMKNVLRRIKEYTPYTCKISAILYASNKKNIDQLSNIKLRFMKKVNVKNYCQLTERQCKELSIKLVAALLASGMPYTTFVYPIWGKKLGKVVLDYPPINIETKKAILSDYKWNTSYFHINNISWAKKISDFQCVRVYQKSDGEFIYFLPFLFMKGIRTSKIDTFYSKVAETFRILGESRLADEIIGALKVKKRWKKDSIEYLACMMSCFCSKAMAEMLQIDNLLNVQEEVSWESFRDSFSEEFLSVLKKINQTFIIDFFKKLIENIGNIDLYFSNDNCGKYVYYDLLMEYVRNESLNKNAYEMTSDIFQWMRRKSIENQGEKIRRILVDDLVSILKEVGKYTEEEIYIAQIECWDRGIATYRFYYDEKIGIVSDCGVGEMSAVIRTLRYQKLVRKYYTEKLLYDGVFDEEARRVIINNILENAITDGGYSSEDILVFRNILEERQESLYGMLI